MPILNWLGKEKVINHHHDVPFHILEHRYTYGAKDTGNKIIHGDNLLALKSLLPEYEGCVKCIYIDPPYNTGNEGWVYNDNVNDPKIKKWLGEVVGREGEDLSRHDKWLCMMYPRLRLLQRLLTDDGAIFISIDENEHSNMKLICNEIFGASNFVATLIWQKRKGGGNDSSFIAVDHEYVLVFCKNIAQQLKKWRVPYDPDYTKRYKFEDETGNYYYDTLSRPGLNNPIIFDVICPDGSLIKDGSWQVSKKTFDEGLESGEIAFIKNKSGGYSVVRKVRLPEGKVFRSIITVVSNKDAADEMASIFQNKKEFSTPKPELLVNHLLQLASTPDSIILDSFAGSGTTAHAVLNMNKADGGNRKFILVEMEDYAETITAERVRRVIDGYADVGGTGGGFDYYELGDPLMLTDGNLNEDVPAEKICEYIWYTETRTEYVPQKEAYLLGTRSGTAYYFYYEKDMATVLGHKFLQSIKSKASGYIIYADMTTLGEDELEKMNIRFKKIPRDITRF
ncbi:MAG: site-specific DNA-methyltransferase [Holophagaceae bacterium]|nr:site-specific DNA-methyltransferase [Holophagaceae bacterium]